MSKHNVRGPNGRFVKYDMHSDPAVGNDYSAEVYYAPDDNRYHGKSVTKMLEGVEGTSCLRPPTLWERIKRWFRAGS